MQEYANMASPAIPFLTPEQYLDIEREAVHKSECWRGEMFDMSAATRSHNLIAINIASLVHGNTFCWPRTASKPISTHGRRQASGCSHPPVFWRISSNWIPLDAASLLPNVTRRSRFRPDPPLASALLLIGRILRTRPAADLQVESIRIVHMEAGIVRPAVGVRPRRIG